MNNYFQALKDLTSADNFKRKVAEFAVHSWIKDNEIIFRETLFLALSHEDSKVTKSALVVIRYAIKHHSRSDLVELAIIPIISQDSECENLSVLCCAEGLAHDYLIGGRLFLTLINLNSIKSIKILTCFLESLESINQSDFLLIFNHLKNLLQVKDFTLICLKCLKISAKFINSELFFEFVELSFQFLNHEDPSARSESLEILLDFYESKGKSYFELSPLLKVLKFDFLNNRFMATEILIRVSVQLNEDLIEIVLGNLKDKELWEISVEFLRKSFETSDYHVGKLLNSLENSPAMFLAVLSAAPSRFEYDLHVQQVFLSLLNSEDMKIVKKALFSLYFNKNWCLKINDYLRILQVVIDLFQKDSKKIKFFGLWAVLQLSERNFNEKQVNFLLGILLKLECEIEESQIRWLAISNLLKKLPKQDVFKFFVENLSRKIEKKLKNSEFYSIIHCFNQCLLLSYPEFRVDAAEIRRILNVAMNFPNSSEVLQFFEILENFFSDFYQKNILLINLYKEKN